MWLRHPDPCAAPNLALEPTACSVRSYLAPASCGGPPQASGPSSTGVERRYAPAEATVVIGKIAFAFPIRPALRESCGLLPLPRDKQLEGNRDEQA